MKATLEFQLPEDNEEHLVAVLAVDWYLTVWDFDRLLCGWFQNGHKFVSADEALETINDEFRRLIEERGLSLDMMS